MKIRSLFFGVLAALALTAGFTSCSDDDDDNNGGLIIDPVVNEYALVLNEGSWGNNNATLSAFNWRSHEVFDAECVYKAINNQALGDVGQDIIRDDRGNIYISMFGSAYVCKLKNNGEEICRTYFNSCEMADLGQPRYLAIEDGFLYVSCYGDYVAKLKASDLSYVGKVKVGNNPERFVIEDDVLYCTSSVDESYVADNRLAVIDLKKFDSAKFFTPMSNMDRILESNDRIFVQGYGDYYDYPWGEVNITTGEFTKLGNASCWAENDDVIYTVNSVTDWSTYEVTNYFATYNTKTSQLTEGNYLKNAPAELLSASVYGMEFNPYTDYLYVMTSNFTTNGKVYVFDKNLNYVTMFSTTGINPKTMVFFK